MSETSNRKSKLRAVLSRIGLVLLPIVILALIGEIALRIDFAIRRPPLLPAPEGIRLNPNSHGIVDGTLVEINRNGMRDDRDYTARAAENVTRIAFIGDSVTFGTGVELDETYVKQLELLLNENSQPPTEYEVLNFGIPGTSTQHHAGMVNRAEALNPDIIILSYFLNDAEPSAETALAGGSNPALTSALAWVKRQVMRSYLVRFIVEKMQIAVLARATIDNAPEASPTERPANATPSPTRTPRPTQSSDGGDRGQDGGGESGVSASGTAAHSGRGIHPSLRQMIDWYTTDSDSYWTANQFYLSRYVDEVQSGGLTPIILIFPLEVQVDGTGIATRPQELIMAYCADHDLACIDLAPLLEAEITDSGEDLFLDGIHLNPTGHKVVAGLIYQSLLDGGYIQP